MSEVVVLTTVCKTGAEARDIIKRRNLQATVRQFAPDVFVVVTAEGARELLRDAEANHVSRFI